MGCFFGIIGFSIIWPASGYFLLGIIGLLGLRRQGKLLSLIQRQSDWLDQKIPYIKFKNTKPISKNVLNIFENIIIKLPLRLIITLPITFIGFVLAYYSIMSASSCF